MLSKKILHALLSHPKSLKTFQFLMAILVVLGEFPPRG